MIITSYKQFCVKEVDVEKTKEELEKQKFWTNGNNKKAEVEQEKSREDKDRNDI